MAVLSLLVPVGRATARDVGEFVGIVASRHPVGPPDGLGTAGVPVPLLELQEEMGFQIRFPGYVPEGSNLSRVVPFQRSNEAIGVQIDYTSVVDESGVLSIRESKPRSGLTLALGGERVTIDGMLGVIIDPGGPRPMLFLQWVDGDIVMEVESTLSRDELIRIAESFR